MFTVSSLWCTEVSAKGDVWDTDSISCTLHIQRESETLLGHRTATKKRLLGWGPEKIARAMNSGSHW